LTKHLRYLLLLPLTTAVFVIGFFYLPQATYAQMDADDRVVSEVEIQGNETVSYQTIISQIRTVPGRSLSTHLLSEDLKRLYSLGYFKDVQIRQTPEDGKVKITFIVKEKAILRDIEITGNNKIKKKGIENVLRAKVGDFVDEQTIRRDVEGIRQLYQEKGFYEVGVRHKLDFDPTSNQANLKIMIDEGTKLVVRKIDFEGVTWVEAGDLLKRVQTKPAFWWFVPGVLKEDIVDLDLQRIRAFYDEQGFSDTKVSYRLEDTETAGDVNLIFVVEEGRQYLVGEVEFSGNTIFTDADFLEALTLKPGSPFSRRGLRQSVGNIQDLYFEKGYMNARVIFDSIYNDETGSVDTKYKITENNVTYVNRATIRGNTKTKDIVIRRELRVYPGEPFNGAALKRSKQRLFNLGYFEEIQFDTEDTADPDRKDLLVTVKETKTGEFSFGGGFSSVDRAVGFVQIRQRNFDHANWPNFTGAGEDLSLRLQIGSVRSQGEVSWTDPWFMGYPFSLGFDLYRREFDRTRSSGLFFDEKRTGARVRFGKEFTDFDRLSMTYGYENVDIDNIPDEASALLKAEEGEKDLSRLGLTLTRDTRDNRFVPTEGYLLQGGGELVGSFLGGDEDFWRSTGLAAGYWEYLKNVVLEVKLRAGISDAIEDSETIPIFERFYAGGANTIRGYKERRVGPRDGGTGDPIGGEAFWVANVETTFPLVPGVIKGAAFYDLGNVDEKIEDFGGTEVFQGVGLGVRIKTPIGPVKVDAGYPIDDIEGEEKELRFYFNMSRGF